MITTLSELYELYLSPMPNRTLNDPKHVVCRGRFGMAVVTKRGTIYSSAATSRRRFRFLDRWARTSLVDMLADIGVVSRDVAAEYHANREAREQRDEASILLSCHVPDMEKFGVKLTKAQRKKLATAARRP